jgi:hypothetical protein
MKARKGICNVYATSLLGDDWFKPLEGESSQQQNQIIQQRLTNTFLKYNDSTVPLMTDDVPYSTLPFKKVPHVMLAHMVYFFIFWINSFPAKCG